MNSYFIACLDSRKTFLRNSNISQNLSYFIPVISPFIFTMASIPQLESITHLGPPQKCSWSSCPNQGLLLCTRCREAKPETYYCSQMCQKTDWESHKTFCNEQVYIFDVEILNSSNPKISRSVSVPSWWNFKQLHYVLQYIFLPWQNHHPHTFQFLGNDPESYSRKEVLLELYEEGSFEIYKDYVTDNWLDERWVKLSSVFGGDGTQRRRVMVNGTIAPLVYAYDFGGSCWDHKITFVGTEWARAARPIIKKATGCGPIENCGGIHEWNRVKEAFAAVSPTREQGQRRQWARLASEHADFDALREPDVMELNHEVRWEAYLKALQRTEQGEKGYYRFCTG